MLPNCMQFAHSVCAGALRRGWKSALIGILSVASLVTPTRKTSACSAQIGSIGLLNLQAQCTWAADMCCDDVNMRGPTRMQKYTEVLARLHSRLVDGHAVYICTHLLTTCVSSRFTKTHLIRAIRCDCTGMAQLHCESYFTCAVLKQTHP